MPSDEVPHPTMFIACPPGAPVLASATRNERNEEMNPFSKLQTWCTVHNIRVQNFNTDHANITIQSTYCVSTLFFYRVPKNFEIHCTHEWQLTLFHARLCWIECMVQL